MSRRVFVYGTLLAREPNHHVLGGAEFLGPARTTSAYLRMTFRLPLVEMPLYW
jgi:gamma-glutamylcyclotransferase (GGCT)/AIG2-like uncharacterized protein YtfP